MYSEGYKFLEAVKKKDGTVVLDLLRTPGSTVINTRDVSSGETALHIATQRRDLTWLNFLLGKRANPNIADKKGLTPLMLAVQTNFLEGVQALTAAGAKVDEANSAGETPLISAVHRRDLPLMRLLLAAGADPDRNDNSGRSARDYAELEGGASPLVAELKRHDDTRRTSGKTYGPSF
nr:ankyrin repeat domain-containing protein [Altericroceibacterium xinjiangense]